MAEEWSMAKGKNHATGWRPDKVLAPKLTSKVPSIWRADDIKIVGRFTLPSFQDDISQYGTVIKTPSDHYALLTSLTFI